MIERNLQANLCELANTMPVVAVTGPRQSGKTTLCRYAFPEKPYVSLEPLDIRDYAVKDPRGFLRDYQAGAVIDEIQHAPDLLSYLQEEVDDKPEPGRFVLTGSQHFAMTEAITQTLAGRIAILYLLPPSYDELKRFGDLPNDIWSIVWTGAYPRIYDRGLDPQRWLADYVTTYVQRDVRQVLNVTDLEAFNTFLKLMAGRTANELSLSSLCGDAGVTHPTLRAWLSVLETSFLCIRLPAWHHSYRKQAIKSAKLHFLDTGLACYLLGVTEPSQLVSHPLRGALFESWVVSEVLKWRLHRGLPQRMFHLRHAKGLEVDLVIEEGGRLTATEVKSAATVATDFFKSLRQLGSDVSSHDHHLEFDARVVYGGDTGQQREAARVIPWHQIHALHW